MKVKVTTKYIGPVGLMGSRVVASVMFAGRQRTLRRPYDCSLSRHENHQRVADLLLAKWELDHPSIEKEFHVA